MDVFVTFKTNGKRVCVYRCSSTGENDRALFFYYYFFFFKFLLFFLSTAHGVRFTFGQRERERDLSIRGVQQFFTIRCTFPRVVCAQVYNNISCRGPRWSRPALEIIYIFFKRGRSTKKKTTLLNFDALVNYFIFFRQYMSIVSANERFFFFQSSFSNNFL